MRRIRHLTHRHRTPSTNHVLGGLLALVAGAINAGGFLVLQRYTSHMSGFLAQVADGLVLHNAAMVLSALGVLLAFFAGAAVCGALMQWANALQLHSVYALPLIAEALLLLPFGLLGGTALAWQTPLALPLTVVLLAFIMGLQNAVGSCTAIGSLRTTHMTGNVTDAGSLLGQRLVLMAQRRSWRAPLLDARIRVVGGLVVMFVLGGVLGTWGFLQLGFICVLPLAALLLSVSIPPLLSDMHHRRVRHRARQP